MKNKKLLIALFLLIIISCREHPSKIRSNKITKMCFATGGCFGTCPFLAIEIDSNLNYKFYGSKYAKLQGYYLGKISQGLWDTINMKFEFLQYRSLDTNVSSVDDMSFQSIIHFGKYIKKIEHKELELPKDVRENFIWLMNSYKNLDLIKQTDTILFETEIQNGPPRIPPPLY
jgi:hypothetical protein